MVVLIRYQMMASSPSCRPSSLRWFHRIARLPCGCAPYRVADSARHRTIGIRLLHPYPHVREVAPPLIAGSGIPIDGILPIHLRNPHRSSWRPTLPRHGGTGATVILKQRRTSRSPGSGLLHGGRHSPAGPLQSMKVECPDDRETRWHEIQGELRPAGMCDGEHTRPSLRS